MLRRANPWSVFAPQAAKSPRLLLASSNARHQKQHTDAQLVELKNGVTYNGHLVEVDNYMNITLREVYQTSADGERFWKMKEMFIKGMVVSFASVVGDRIRRHALSLKSIRVSVSIKGMVRCCRYTVWELARLKGRAMEVKQEKRGLDPQRGSSAHEERRYD